MLLTTVPAERMQTAQASLERVDALAYANRVLGQLVDVAVRGARDLEPEVGRDHSAARYIDTALGHVQQILGTLGAAAIVDRHQRLLQEKDAEITRMAARLRELEAL